MMRRIHLLFTGAVLTSLFGMILLIHFYVSQADKTKIARSASETSSFLGVSPFRAQGENHRESRDEDCFHDTELMKRVADRNRERQRHLQAVCGNISEDVRPFRRRYYDHLMVDDKHQVIYCYIPKVGCTNWRRMMVRLSGNYHGNPYRRIPVHNRGVMKHYGIRGLNSYSYANITWRLKHYKKFLLGRNPYERLLSGYKNKFLEHEWYFIFKFGKQIKRRFRGTQKGGRVRFDEFVRWIIELDKKDGYFDHHWRQYNRLCHPCDIQYDFIGKMETMAEDSEYIIRHFYNHSCPPKFPQKPGGHKTTDHLTSKYYANITDDITAGLYEVYKRDFDMFNYSHIPPKV